MLRYEKRLLAAFLHLKSDPASDDASLIALDALLPDETLRFQFLTHFVEWYQEHVDATAEVETILHAETLHERWIRRFCLTILDANDIDVPFEPPSIEQVAWVMRCINTNKGSFRALLYDRMGFDESAYVALLVAGGMSITNAMFDAFAQATPEETADVEAERLQEEIVHDPINRALLSLCVAFDNYAGIAEKDASMLYALFTEVYTGMSEETIRKAYIVSQTDECQALMRQIVATSQSEDVARTQEGSDKTDL